MGAFGALQPDRGELAAPMMVADGCIPTPDGYGPYPSLFVPSTATALPGAPRGVFSIVLNAGQWEAFALTADSLYQLNADYTWTSAIATGYACPTGYDWSGLHFGNYLLFTNTADGLHSYNVEAGGAPTYISGAGDPAYVFTCANFVIALNCKDANGNRDARLIKTSGFNDQTNWTTDGADYQELADGENLLCGFDLKQNNALLVQQRAFVLMQFGNAPGGAQFSLQKISNGRGAVAAKSCVSFDGLVFGLATDGFWRFDLTNGLKFIGANEVDQTFLKMVDQANFGLVQAAVDPIRRVVLWRYKRSVDSSTTVSEVGIGYEWEIGRWFTITEESSYLTRMATVAVSYDAATGTYDSQTLTYDDLFWSGAAPLFGGLDANYKFAFRTGPCLAGTLTTGVAMAPVRMKFLWATPTSDSSGMTLDIGVKDELDDDIVFQGPASKVDGGRVPIEAQGLYYQMRLLIPAGDSYTYANGIEKILNANGIIKLPNGRRRIVPLGGPK
jgi:hypothetical protein